MIRLSLTAVRGLLLAGLGILYLRSRLAQGIAVMTVEMIERLSKREQQVLGLVARGLQTADVARVLQISANTVCTHVKSIYRKRNLGSRAEAALEAQRLGLV